MAERAEELRQQLDMQRADISRTVEEIENRVVPSRVLNRRKYRMRRSVLDFKDRLFGNEEADYPAHWYAQPAAPLGAEYGSSYGSGTSYGFEGGGSGGGGRMDDMRERAGGAMHGVTDRASGAMHSASETASGVASTASERASGMVHGAQETISTVGERLTDTPQILRRQTQGSPTALGLVAFGAGLLAGSLLPESSKEKQLAGRAQPQLQKAVEGTKGLATEVVADLRDTAQEAAQELKETATQEAQAFKEDASSEAQAAKSDVQSVAKE